MGGTMKYFLKKILSHEIFSSIVSWATKIFSKNLQNPPAPPPTYLMYAPLILFASAIIETSTYYLLHCPTYTNERMTLLNKIKSINCSILEFSDVVVTKILLFGDSTLSDSCNTLILNSTIVYIISTKRFDESILTPG